MIKEMFKKTEIQVALISVIGIVIAIIGSIIATNITNNGQLEQQRIEAVREMKRTYYNQLTEAYIEKLMYIDKPDSIEKINSEKKFLVEASRLPLYASQEMIEFIERMKNPNIAAKTSVTEFYKIMRKDLCSNDFENFKDLSNISISIPNKVVITDSEGNKIIQEK